jgi:16S rRNA (guanine527-N7)-methyltransferase
MSEAAEFQRLADRYGLHPAAAEQFSLLAGLVASDPNAPTTVRESSAILKDHLADSLVALELPAIRLAGSIADLGAGGGFPGLPLAIALPPARIALVESVGRKCSFMRRAVELLGLSNTEVVNERAESWPEGVGRFDAVSARALAPLNIVAEYAAPLLTVGGSLIAWRGKREPQIEADALAAAEILGLSVQPPIQVFPYEAAENRFLHVMTKVSETPPRFPRRPGMARKRPLVSSN